MGAPDTDPPARPAPGSGLDDAERLAALQRLADDVAHDLGNSLAALTAFSQMLRTDPNLPPSLRRQADLLVEEVNRTRALVHGLLEAARGRATLEAPRGRAIPVDGSSEPTETAETMTATRPARVLVVDDEAAIRAFLARILRRSGYEPIVAAEGAAALEMIRTDPPDAILCDHRMAGMNGTAFHDAVAAVEPELARRFVFMSGDVLDSELRDFALERGIVLLAKPFDIDGVTRTVAAVLAS